MKWQRRVAAAAALWSGLCAADPIDDYVRATLARERIPGLVLGIATGVEGQRVRSYSAVRTYGLANLEHQVAVRPNTIFQSGSVGKQFTAAAILLQVEDGKLGLDDPIARYFPSDRPHWRAITIRHLLTHTAGLPDYYDETGSPLLDLRRDYTEQELLQRAMQLEPQFAPGERWAYSNTGYVVLGALIRKLTGKFYGDVLRERIFVPAGMETARVISEEDIVPNRSAGYEIVGNEVKNQGWVSPSLNTTADGALYLTVRDLLSWDVALRERRLLNKTSYDAIWRPVQLNDGTHYPYGFGWFIGEQRGSLNIEHGGSWQGFRTHIARYVERGLSIVVMCNLAQCEAGEIAHQVAGLADPLLLMPDPQVLGRDEQPHRTRVLREVLAAWSAGKAHEGMSAGFAKHMDPSARTSAQRRDVAEQLERETVFRYLAEDDVREAEIGRSGSKVYRIVHCATVTPTGTQSYRFYLDENGKVTDIGVEGW